MDITDLTKKELIDNLSKDELDGLGSYEKVKIKLIREIDSISRNTEHKRCLEARLESVTNCIILMYKKAKIIDMDKPDENEHSVTKEDGTLKTVEEAFGN